MLAKVRRLLKSVSDARTGPSAVSPVLTVRIRPDEVDGGFVAECLELPGCVSDGDSEEEAMHNIAEAIIGVLAVRILRSAQASTAGHAVSNSASKTEHDHRVALFA
jgi:predicted RNase H-like HicB family nuclease